MNERFNGIKAIINHIKNPSDETIELIERFERLYSGLKGNDQPQTKENPHFPHSGYDAIICDGAVRR